ncbi:hypothetical protein H0H92_007383 [Tricholoma furcatifolium]|nr:hypothetical protein H0H92_007383 [Tricholoma furcatifolium]
MSSETNSPQLPVLACVEPLLFFDGNLLIEAEGTRCCVHASVLTHASRAFSEIWHRKPRADGNIVGLRLLNVRFNDLALWMGQLYGNIKFFYWDAPWKISELSSLLETSLTLKHDELHDAIVRHLRQLFPYDLDKWDASLSRRVLHRDDREGGEFALVHLLDRHNVKTGLPGLFYIICTKYTEHDITHGTFSDMGTHFCLTDIDRVRCLEGRQSLLDATELPWNWLRPSTVKPRCNTDAACTAIRNSIFVDVLAGFDQLSPSYKIRALEPWNDEWVKFLCNDCTAYGKMQHTCARLQVWENLPAFWYFADWHELFNADLTILQVPEIQYEYVSAVQMMNG